MIDTGKRKVNDPMSNLSEKAAQNLALVREKRPLVHSITNMVTMNFTANVLLSMGAYAIMAHAHSEVEETATIADALVLNMGTLSEERTGAMARAGKKYNDRNKPVILDPVGTGASTYRTFAARKILRAVRIGIVCGNASEILSLVGKTEGSKGVDAAHPVEAAVDTARTLAGDIGATVAVTGPVDTIVDGNAGIRILNGHPLMGYVTGFGCAATAAIGAFAVVDPHLLTAAATALVFFGVAGEIAGETAAGPGTFITAFLDALYGLTPEALEKRCRTEEA
jgi:hydroxyethylthiazole kinase